MSYHVYQTEGFIVGSIPINEASRYISIYTEDLGLVRGIAQGVRSIGSKLKHSLQDLSYSKVSFVRGKEVWRIINSESLPILGGSMLNKNRRELVAKIAAILKRFVRGEGSDQALFNEIKSSLYFLDVIDFKPEEFEKLELLIVLRIFNHLGYISDNKIFKDSLFLEDEIDINKIGMIEGREEDIILAINNAISHSHL